MTDTSKEAVERVYWLIHESKAGVAVRSEACAMLRNLEKDLAAARAENERLTKELARVRRAAQRAYDHVLKDAADWYEAGSFEAEAIQIEADALCAALTPAPQPTDNTAMVEALREVSQALAWQCFGECRGFSENLKSPSDALSLARTAIASRGAPKPAGEAVPTCVACEDNPKHPNIPCAVCGAHPPQPSETVAEAVEIERLTKERDNLSRLEQSHREQANEQFHRAEKAEAENQRLREALRECEAEIDRYIWQEYPLDHPVHERYRQRDFIANPARAALSSGEGE